MISIICDKCEETFQVDPATSGPKVPCPNCGDINRVEAGLTAPPAPAGAAAGNGPEQEVSVVRPAMFRAHPFRYALVVLLLIGGVAGAIASAAIVIAAWLAIPCVILAVGAAGWFAWWWLTTHWWMRLIISNKRTVRHEGIIRRHTTEVLHDHVRSVDINQTFMQRILKVGSIGIDSAGQDGVEIEVRDIPAPYEVKRVIDQYRKM